MWAIDTVGHTESCLARALILARGLRERVVEMRGDTEGQRAFAVGLCVFPILLWQMDSKEIEPSVKSIIKSSKLGARLGLGDAALRRRDIAFRLQRAIFPMLNPTNRESLDWWDAMISSPMCPELSEQLALEPAIAGAIAGVGDDELDGLREAWEAEHWARWPGYALIEILP